MSVVKRIAFLFLLLGTSACGNDVDESTPVVVLPEWAKTVPERCGEDRAELLKRVPDGIKDASWTKSDWLLRAYDALRQATKTASDADSDLQPLADARGRRRLARADVLLLGTRHQSGELARVRHRLILQLLQDGSSRPSGLAVVLECVPVSAAAELRHALGKLNEDDGKALRALLRARWPWPVEPHVALLRELVPLGVRVIPAGVVLSKWVPDGKVADEDRSPQGEAGVGPVAFAAWVDEFNAVNRAATKAARTWIKGGPGRKAVIDCGLLHHFAGKVAIADELRKAGLEVVIEIGFVKEIEVALLARFGAETCRAWFDLGSGLLRCPYPGLEEIVAEDWGKRR